MLPHRRGDILKLEKDKLLHIGACGFISAIVGSICLFLGFGIFSPFIGLGTSLIIGFCKEIHDGRRDEGHNSPEDIKADIIGAVAGTLMVIGLYAI